MNKLIIIAVVVLVGVGAFFIFNKDTNMQEGESKMEGDVMDTMDKMEGLEGIHIMSDGTVMLGDGEVLEDATVTEDGKIKLGDGQIVEPVMDMRQGDSMDDTMMDDGTHMENE